MTQNDNEKYIIVNAEPLLQHWKNWTSL